MLLILFILGIFIAFLIHILAYCFIYHCNGMTKVNCLNILFIHKLPFLLQLNKNQNFLVLNKKIGIVSELLLGFCFCIAGLVIHKFLPIYLLIFSLCCFSSITDTYQLETFQIIDFYIFVLTTLLGINKTTIVFNFIILSILYFIFLNKIGYGDIQLYFVLCSIFDNEQIFYLILLSNSLALTYILIQGIKKDTKIPLVPFISIAYVVLVILNNWST